MKACRNSKKGVYYNIVKEYPWTRGIKIKSIILVAILTICFLTTPILVAYGQPHRVSRTITATIHVMPKVELHINPTKIDNYSVSLDSKNLLNVLSSENNDLSVSRVFRDGQETLIVTKVCE